VTWGGSVGVFENSGSNAYLSVLSSDTYVAGVGFGTAAHRVSANVNWNSTTKAFNLATNTASAYLVFSTDTGTERMRITSGGLVGINNTNPQYILDVSGSSQFKGNMIISGNLLPGGPYTANTSSYNLGSPTQAWKDLYVSNGSVYFLNDNISSSISLNDNGSISIPNASLTGSLQGTASFSLTSSYIDGIINGGTF